MLLAGPRTAREDCEDGVNAVTARRHERNDCTHEELELRLPTSIQCTRVLLHLVSLVQALTNLLRSLHPIALIDRVVVVLLANPRKQVVCGRFRKVLLVLAAAVAVARLCVAKP